MKKTIEKMLNCLSNNFKDSTCRKAYFIGLKNHLDESLAKHLISCMTIPEYNTFFLYLDELGLTPDISLELLKAKFEDMPNTNKTIELNKWDAYYEISHALCFNKTSVDVS